jgi:hypothetical protein
MLDAILEPERSLRHYFFDAYWGVDEMKAFMYDVESGDDYIVLFTPHGAIINGNVIDSPMWGYFAATGKPWPGVIDEIPSVLRSSLNNPAFVIEENTFCIWRTNEDTSWRVGKVELPEGGDPDGSRKLLFILDGNPLTYQRWSESYYKRIVPLEIVKHIYDHKPLTKQLIEQLNPNVTLDNLNEDINEIGYPLF